MDNIKNARVISIFKLILFCFIEVLWCVSESRLNNLAFIIILAILILVNILKIVLTVINALELYRTVVLFVLWITELCLTSSLLTLLFYVNGFDLKDILGFIVNCFILISSILEVVEFAKFLKSFINNEK
ncbi:MAG: hypothetical protein ACI4QN_04090 [Candidatus Coproplasma sp.]